MTINGLPIMLKRPSSASMDIENLDVYYEDCVIGGPSAFVIPIHDRAQFKEATRTKLCSKWRAVRRLPRCTRLRRRAARLLPDRRTPLATALGRHPDFN